MPHFSGSTVLVIEDEKPMRDALVSRFKKEGFLEIYEAEDGKKGLAMALDKRPSIIILDLALPKMKGLDVLKELREDVWGKKAPIVILTISEESEEINREVSKSEPSFYLVKTKVSLDDIVEKVGEVIG